MKEFLLANQETLLQSTLIILSLVAIMLALKYLTKKPVYTEEEVAELPKATQIEIKTKVTETRYEEKKVQKNTKDVNRFGRFKVTYEDGSEKSKMGNLIDILNDVTVKTYREIK